MGDLRIPRNPEERRKLYDEAGLTVNERVAVEAWCAARPPLTSIDDLLTPAEQVTLRADLAEIARQRRRAEGESATWVLP